MHDTASNVTRLQDCVKMIGHGKLGTLGHQEASSGDGSKLHHVLFRFSA